MIHEQKNVTATLLAVIVLTMLFPFAGPAAELSAGEKEYQKTDENRQQTELLSGDERLACEAILCLSSPARPGECSPSLDRYFGIRKKKWSNTVNARRNFLNSCPTATESDVMLTLTSAIAYAAGNCGVEQLNARGEWVERRTEVSLYSCRTNKDIHLGNYHETWSLGGDYPQRSYGRDAGFYPGETTCVHTVRYWVVDPNPPSACLDLWQHENTYFEPVQFIRGQKPWDHRWVEK